MKIKEENSTLTKVKHALERAEIYEKLVTALEDGQIYKVKVSSGGGIGTSILLENQANNLCIDLSDYGSW